ncbi:putative polyketide synthase [Hypomontagnella monticulosa]|nr:putative polyketide synthase [Hypomontagnella monticulosa]
MDTRSATPGCSDALLTSSELPSSYNSAHQQNSSSCDTDRLGHPILDSELDGDEVDPIAICGFSVKFPEDATSPEALWKMMMERRCAMTEFPADRINANGFYQKRNGLQTLPLRGGHFIKDDPSAFDAEFFNISPTEAASMDPMQRWLLETAYRALENAGIPMESISGSSAAVYTGSFSLDYMLQLCRDPENPPTYAAVGFGLSMLANRLSWFFNLRGPSIGLDSACSSTAMAIDIACQTLRSGSSNMAMVAGSNLANSPEPYLWMSNINFLSPDSRCHSFDHRANGYARGEGIGVVVLKRLSDAIRDGNTIRAVIRSTGSNEDGRTPGITQPSRQAQESLIRETYGKAGLSMKYTRFFEAHGTGTQAGDPREAQAIGSAFQKYRSNDDPLYVGALKSNIGHLEGASGLAAVIKAVLVLEKGVIPPNTNFEKVNPKIDTDFLKLRFPTESCPWPTSGLRRASINSFGYGGSNSHIVLDDAYNYMRLRDLHGKHNTVPQPPRIASAPNSTPNGLSNGISNGSYLIESDAASRVVGLPRLFVWSAADKKGVGRIVDTYRNYYDEQSLRLSKDDSFLANMAYTLDTHRSRLQWKSFALLQTPASLKELLSRMSPPIRSPAEAPRLGFVFSGQGAQWYAMGRELTRYSTFNAELDRAGKYLASLGCCWSVIDELSKSEEDSKIDSAEFSQTLCTVLQVAIVNLLRRFNVRPHAVVGHSSGEIAAAYAAGYLSCESAWKLAYFRGLCSAELSELSSHQPLGAMMSVGLSESDAENLVAAANQEAIAYGVSIACINSPKNVTISGEEQLIDRLKTQLDEQNVFARRLRVGLAYHSRQMEAISAKYMALVGSLAQPHDTRAMIPMISSVTGARVAPKLLAQPSYWAMNMVSPVQFSQAVSAMCAQSAAALVKKIDKSHVFASVVDHLVEVGPHAALQGPIRDILRASPRGKSIGYSSVLRRGQSAMETVLHVMGELYCMGTPLNLRAINEPSNSTDVPLSRSLLVDLPEYPFDHSQLYWHESRLSRNYRLRDHAPSELLGVRSRDWNASDARWRHFIRVAEMPWTEQHVVNGTVLYPGAGMLVMAIEAAKQLVGETREISSYTLNDVHLEGPIDLTASAGTVEVQTSLRETQSHDESGPEFQFVIQSYINDDWRLNCRGSIAVEVLETQDNWAKEKGLMQRQALSDELLGTILNCQTAVDSRFMYSFLKQSGYEYGPIFQAANNQRYNRKTRQAAAKISLASLSEEHVVHPASLDAMLHLCFTAFTSGGTQRMATSIPSAISRLWVSNEGLSWPHQKTATACVTIDQTTKRGFSCNGGALECSPSGDMRMWFEGLEMTNVTSAPPSSDLPDPKQFCMNIDCKVALNKLSHSETYSYLNSLHPVREDMTAFFQDLELLMELSLERLSQSFDPSVLGLQEAWKRQYWNWAEYHLARIREQRDPAIQSHASQTDRTFEELSDKLRDANHLGHLYVVVASNLVSLFKDEANPLELLMKTELLKNYYDELTSYRCMAQCESYMDLLAHQAPGLNILEVGGGTASATRKFIRALRANDDTGSLRCSRYHFTDISASFLEKAREEFSSFHSQMTFSTLDIERDLTEQGLEEGAYDVIVADGVLHVTHNIAHTLRNIRKALKPGGKLIMPEMLKADGWIPGFVFGLFPGWWLGTDDNRTLSPNLSADSWDAVLKENGFSGADMVLKDFETDAANHLGCIIATATEQTNLLTPPRQTYDVTIIINPASLKQQALAGNLISLKDHLGGELRIQSIETAIAAATTTPDDSEKSEDQFIFFLADYGESFLASLNDTTWKYLQSLVETSRRVLWVSAGGGRDASPEHGMLDGLARTLRSEYYELHLVTVALDINDPKTDKALHLIQVAEEMVSRAPHAAYEQDYIEIDGLLHTRRLVEAQYLKSDMDARLLPYKIAAVPAGQAKFEISTSGGDAHYVESSPFSGRGPEGDDVDIAVKAVSLQVQDRVAASGSEEHPALGSYCAGVVLQAGPGAKYFPGDRVFVAHARSFRSHVRVSSRAIVRIAPDTTFSSACGIFPRVLTAYNALIEIGKVQQNDKILIHDGASPAGQAALQLLINRGIPEVWATATNEEESTMIAMSFKIPPGHILPKSWFSSSSMLASKWKRTFDVVFSPCEGKKTLRMDCVRSGGRYIGVRTGLMSSDDTQVKHVPTNVALSIIQPGSHIISQDSLQYAASNSHNSTLDRGRHHVTEFSASDLAGALSRLQGANDGDMVVVNMNEGDMINVRTRNEPTYMMDSRATYVIAGGLGGLGRSVARWLVDRGARYLILLSRSGPRTPEAHELLAELNKKGARVETPVCDVANRAALKAVLASCSKTMPPIRGCIQSSLVMTEKIFQTMSFRDWEVTVDPKVKGSWNLHAELPTGLDFFILISSMMGIAGSGSLSAYNAGNTYQDALAHYRVSQGERAVTLNLGAVGDGGYLVEHSNHIPGVLRNEKYAVTYVRDLCALLDIFCDTDSPLPRSVDGCQAVIGIRPPAHWKHAGEVPATMYQPFWGHMHHIPPLPGQDRQDSSEGTAGMARHKRALDAAERLAAAGSLAEAAEIISESLAHRVSAMLGTAEDRLDAHKPMHMYGLDSLSAIDVRNWVGKVFDVDMPVFEILGGATFASAGMSIARQLRH